MLEHDADLTAHAQAWAETLITEYGGALKHDVKGLGENYEGENLAGQFLSGPLDKVAGCKHANAMWYVPIFSKLVDVDMITG